MGGRWWTLGLVCAAVFMLTVDITAVNVALPEIAGRLGAGFTELQWVVDAYTLALAALSLAGGSLSDLLGRRRLFAAGLAGFGAASLACGLAPSGPALIAFRGVQGAAAALVSTTALALLGRAFPAGDPRRRLAFGAWGAASGVAVSIGPLLGGALVTVAGWRSVFLVNVPVAAVAVAVTLVRIEESRDPDRARLDWAGLTTLAPALFLLVFGLLEVNRRGFGQPVVASLAASAGLLAALVVLERRRPSPMLDMALFRRPAFTGAQLGSFLQTLVFTAMLLYLTLYLQNLLGYSALATGLVLMLVFGPLLVGSAVAGRLVGRVRPWLVSVVGFGCMAVGMGLLAALGRPAGWPSLVPGFPLLGAGMGLLGPTLAHTAVAAVPPARVGMASGANDTAREAGTATGVALLGVIFQARIASVLHDRLDATPLAGQVPALAEAVSAGRLLQDGPLPAAREAFQAGLQALFLVTAALALIAAATTALLLRRAE